MISALGAQKTKRIPLYTSSLDHGVSLTMFNRIKKTGFKDCQKESRRLQLADLQELKRS